MIGVFSTLMIVLSAFKYEVIRDDNVEDFSSESDANVTTIDKKVFDALAAGSGALSHGHTFQVRRDPQ